MQTIKIITSTESAIELTSEYWGLLTDASHLLLEPELNTILIKRTLDVLREHYESKKNLPLVLTKNICQKLHFPDLENIFNALCHRQEICSRFLLHLNDEKKSKKIITLIKSKNALREHLTLIADTCLLLRSNLSINLFRHISFLVKNKRINKWIELNDLFECSFDCLCKECNTILFETEIPIITRKLHLSVIQLPTIDSFSHSQLLSDAQTSTASALSKPNPFEVLNVSITASKHIIMQQIMTLIKESPDKMASLREAQNELFNPAQRFLHHYFRYLAFTSEPTEIPQKNPPPSSVDFTLDNLPFRKELLSAY